MIVFVDVSYSMMALDGIALHSIDGISVRLILNRALGNIPQNIPRPTYFCCDGAAYNLPVFQPANTTRINCVYHSVNLVFNLLVNNGASIQSGGNVIDINCLDGFLNHGNVFIRSFFHLLTTIQRGEPELRYFDE